MFIMIARHFQRSIALFCVVSLITNSCLYSVALAVENQTPLALIRTPMLEAYAQLEPKEPAKKEDPQKKVAVEEALALAPLSKGAKVKIILDIFPKLPTSFNPSATKIDDTFVKKMEFVHGDNTSSSNLLKSVDNTKTISGTVVLVMKLAEPIFDIPTLQLRQAIIQALLADPALMQQLEKQLNIVSHNENHVLNYFQEIPAATQEYINQVYFGSWLDGLNKNSLALEVKTRLGNLFDLHNFLFLPALQTIDSAIFTYPTVQLMKKLAESTHDQHMLDQLKDVTFSSILKNNVKGLGTGLSLMYNPFTKAYDSFAKEDDYYIKEKKLRNTKITIWQRINGPNTQERSL
jgi:hypothetical protein